MSQRPSLRSMYSDVHGRAIIAVAFSVRDELHGKALLGERLFRPSPQLVAGLFFRMRGYVASWIFAAILEKILALIRSQRLT